jgi:hypothetical protein
MDRDDRGRGALLPPEPNGLFVEATRPHYYNRRYRRIGEVYQVIDPVHMLVLAAVARRIPTPKPPRARK